MKKPFEQFWKQNDQQRQRPPQVSPLEEGTSEWEALKAQIQSLAEQKRDLGKSKKGS